MTSKNSQIARRLLRKESTASEALLWNVLRASRLDGLKFRRQTPVASYIVDFCCYDFGLTIELDGKHHASQPLADANRRAASPTTN